MCVYIGKTVTQLGHSADILYVCEGNLCYGSNINMYEHMSIFYI